MGLATLPVESKIVKELDIDGFIHSFDPPKAKKVIFKLN